MAARKPLVIGGDGLPQQLQSGDTTGTHATFTGTLALPVIAALGTTDLTVTVTPSLAGDALATTDKVSANFGAALPIGIIMSDIRVSAANQVTIRVAAILSLSLAANVALTVTAHR